MFSQQRWFVFGVVFVSSLGIGAYTYFVPVFAQTFGATLLDLGLIGSASAATYAVTTILAGYLSDRFNRAWLLIGGLVTNALLTIALVFSRSVSDVMVLYLMAGVGLGLFWPATEVLIAHLATIDKRVGEMGRYSVVWGTGYIMGPFMGGFVVQKYGFIQLFEVSAAILFVTVVPGLLAVLPPENGPSDMNQTGPWNIFSTVRTLSP